MFQLPVSWGMPDGYDLIDSIPSLARYPLLIMHSSDDTLVPFSHAEALAAASVGRATVYPYRGYHVSALQLIEHRERVLNFLEQHR